MLGHLAENILRNVNQLRGLLYSHGTWTYQDLVDRLRARGIEPFNAGEAIAAYLGSRDPCDLFGGCSGHFNEEGNAALAQAVRDHLSDLTLADRD